METRDKIILVMTMQPDVTGVKLAKAVSVKPITMRYHLLNLASEGYVEKVGAVQSGQAGRPAFRYRLTAKGRSYAAKLSQPQGKLASGS